jgi:hypothetical protein
LAKSKNAAKETTDVPAVRIDSLTSAVTQLAEVGDRIADALFEVARALSQRETDL